MLSLLTFTQIGDQKTAHGFEFEEAESMAAAFAQRIREGSLPPDDAYWWTRVIHLEYDRLDLVEASPKEAVVTVAVIVPPGNSFAGWIPAEAPEPVPLKTMT